MDLGSPLQDIAPGIRGSLLAQLAQLEAPVTRRRLTALAGVSQSGAGKTLDDLVASGLVSEQRAGSAYLVLLNREHLHAEPLLALARSRQRLIEAITTALADWPSLHAAWLYGSVARGNAHRDSDIDILIVAHDLEDSQLQQRLGELSHDLHTMTGNHVQFVEQTPESWEKLFRADNPFCAEIHRDGIPLTAASRQYLLALRKEKLWSAKKGRENPATSVKQSSG